MKSISGTSGMVRQVNRDLLRETLKDMEKASIADLARTSGLSVATCNTLIQELVESGELLELSPESQGGRPARRYTYNVDYSLVAAVMFRTAPKGMELRYSVRNATGEPLDATAWKNAPPFPSTRSTAFWNGLSAGTPTSRPPPCRFPGLYAAVRLSFATLRGWSD